MSLDLTQPAIAEIISLMPVIGNFSGQVPCVPINLACMNFTGSASQYFKGDGTLGTFLVSRVFTNNPSRSIQTVAAAANGWQLSTIRDASVGYACSVTTVATIGGAATGYVVLEVSPTNSTSAASWIEIDRVTNSQTITLAIALQSSQTVSASIRGIVPAGYYARIRSVSVSGSPTFAYGSGQEVLE